MDREILFRGEVKYNGNHLFAGERVEGSLIIKVTGLHFIHVVETDNFGNAIREFEVEVIPETVGQFTGLTDKNGVKIFEGDKIKTPYFSQYVVDNMVDFIYAFDDFNTGDYFGEKINVEVIGNIHDNPELLKQL